MFNIRRVAHEAVGHALQMSKQGRQSASIRETLARVQMAGDGTAWEPTATRVVRAETRTPEASAPEDQGRRREWEDV